eukprot:scaffold119863_cov60-Phaeocystis_antarctica.AAC.1
MVLPARGVAQRCCLHAGLPRGAACTRGCPEVLPAHGVTLRVANPHTHTTTNIPTHQHTNIPTHQHTNTANIQATP